MDVRPGPPSVSTRLACRCAPQVESEFDDKPAHDGNHNRSYSDMVTETRLDKHCRHTLYIQRKVGGVRFGAWKPRAVYRRSAQHYAWLWTSHSRPWRRGAQYFRLDTESPLWRNPFWWPYVAIDMDLGSDGSSGLICLESDLHVGMRSPRVRIST